MFLVHSKPPKKTDPSLWKVVVRMWSNFPFSRWKSQLSTTVPSILCDLLRQRELHGVDDVSSLWKFTERGATRAHNFHTCDLSHFQPLCVYIYIYTYQMSPSRSSNSLISWLRGLYWVSPYRNWRWLPRVPGEREKKEKKNRVVFLLLLSTFFFFFFFFFWSPPLCLGTPPHRDLPPKKKCIYIYIYMFFCRALPPRPYSFLCSCVCWHMEEHSFGISILHLWHVCGMIYGVPL